MGIWTGSVTVEGFDRALLVDSVTMRPIALPLFDDEEEAETFLAYAYSLEYDDIRSMSADSLDRLHSAWLKAGKPSGPKDEDEEEDEENDDDDGDLESLLQASVSVARGARCR